MFLCKRKFYLRCNTGDISPELEGCHTLYCVGTSITDSIYSILGCDPAMWRISKQVHAGNRKSTQPKNTASRSCRTSAQLHFYLTPTRDLNAFVAQCISCSRPFPRPFYLHPYSHPILKSAVRRRLIVPHQVVIAAYAKHYVTFVDYTTVLQSLIRRR